jgi:hypothetical protein
MDEYYVCELKNKYCFNIIIYIYFNNKGNKRWDFVSEKGEYNIFDSWYVIM